MANTIITRIYTDDKGETHFGNLTVPLQSVAIGQISDKFSANGMYIRTMPANYQTDWHNTETNQYVVILSGGVQMEVSNGEQRNFVTGDIILCEDQEGKGHKSRSINNQPRTCLFLPVE